MKDTKAVIISLLALFFLVLSFLFDWLFIIPATILSYFGWKRMLILPQEILGFQANE